MKKFKQGATAVLDWTVWERNADGSRGDLHTPQTSVKVTVYKPNGEKLIDNQDMTEDSAGRLHYDCDIPADADKEVYLVVYAGDDNGRITVEIDNFEVI